MRWGNNYQHKVNHHRQLFCRRPWCRLAGGGWQVRIDPGFASQLAKQLYDT